MVSELLAAIANWLFSPSPAPHTDRLGAGSLRSWVRPYEALLLASQDPDRRGQTLGKADPQAPDQAACNRSSRGTVPAQRFANSCRLY